MGVAGAVALFLVYAGGVAAAPPKAGTDRKPPDKPVASADDAAGSPSWVADELRILRSEVESLRQRPDANLAGDYAALRAEVSKVASAQAELERRLGGVPASAASGSPSAGMSMTGAAVFLTLGFALGWVGSQLSQRWRDRRQRIRL